PHLLEAPAQAPPPPSPPSALIRPVCVTMMLPSALTISTPPPAAPPPAFSSLMKFGSLSAQLLARSPPPPPPWPPSGRASSPVMRIPRWRSTAAPQKLLSGRGSVNTTGPGAPPGRVVTVRLVQPYPPMPLGWTTKVVGASL